MLVDDEIDILEVTKRGLGSLDATAFSDPKAAYNAISNNPKEYCMLITDVRMPGMTGFELVREAKKLNPEIRIVLMTAFEINLDEFRKVLPSTVIDATLTKPFQLSKLQSLVASLLSRNQGSGDGTN
jgi:DNA-binding NtrC family response regulator